MSAREPVSELVALARRQPHAETSRADGASFNAFSARLEQRARRRPWLRVGFALSVVACGVALWLTQPLWPGAPLTYQVVREAKVADVSEQSISRLQFSDGSSVDLGQGSPAHVISTDNRGARVAADGPYKSSPRWRLA